jgi:hypothetical protein
MLKKLALLVIASSFVLTAKADTFVSSDQAVTTNDSGYATVNIAPNPAWAPAIGTSSWVSYAVGGNLSATTGDPSDPNFIVVPDGTVVTFSETFNLDGTATGGTLNVLADDTTSVLLNGNQIFAAALGGSYPTCSFPVAIGCLSSTEGSIDLSDPTILSYFNNGGSNTLSFQVYQENAVSFGLDYSGTITTRTPENIPSTPEPGTFAMLGLGLVGLFAASRRSFAGDFAS